LRCLSAPGRSASTLAPPFSTRPYSNAKPVSPNASARQLGPLGAVCSLHSNRRRLPQQHRPSEATVGLAAPQTAAALYASQLHHRLDRWHSTVRPLRGHLTWCLSAL